VLRPWDTRWLSRKTSDDDEVHDQVYLLGLGFLFACHEHQDLLPLTCDYEGHHRGERYEETGADNACSDVSGGQHVEAVVGDCLVG